MSNPFTPGFAGSPPVFSGRDEQIGEIDEVLERIAEGHCQDVEIILHGPRGIGKTTLLHHVVRRMENASEIRPILVVAPEIATPYDLYCTLLVELVYSRETVTTQGGAQLGLSGTNIRESRETTRMFESTPAELRKRCIDAMAEQPTLLMVDEAHRISSSALDSILLVTNAARRGKTKFGFVMAGVPSLPDLLGRMNATFLERANSIRLERLDAASAKDALTRPFEQAGYEIRLNSEDEDRLVEQTQRYPYFIQCAGHAIWRTAERSDSWKLDVELVESARPVWERRITRMYAARYRELARRNLLPFAHVVAAEYKTSESLDVAKLRSLIGQVNSDIDPQEPLDELEALGFMVAAEGGGNLYEPGIPSLMDHVMGIERAREELKCEHSWDVD